MLTFIWVLALFALLAWSLTAWGLYRLLTLDPQWVGDLQPLIERIPYGEQIERWVPGWQDMLRAALDLMQALLGNLGQAAPWLVGAVWLGGTLFVLGSAALLTWLVRWWRGRPAPPR